MRVFVVVVEVSRGGGTSRGFSFVFVVSILLRFGAFEERFFLLFVVLLLRGEFIRVSLYVVK